METPCHTCTGAVVQLGIGGIAVAGPAYFRQGHIMDLILRHSIAFIEPDLDDAGQLLGRFIEAILTTEAKKRADYILTKIVSLFSINVTTCRTWRM